jgi:nucleotidyltransferase substrate binding protein (TIGR01987 family)
MKQGLSSLANVLGRLAEGLDRDRSDTGDTQIRDGLILRFAFTYEISHKMLKRYLESASANPADFDVISFADLSRTANEQGLLLGNWTDWKRYREMRRRSSHTNDEAVALEVVQGIPAFLAEAQFLLRKLQGQIEE